MPLDGLRACAILWVYIIHVYDFSTNPTVTTCWAKKEIESDGSWTTLRYIMTRAMFAGDLGVDIFFVLSGFLISFILLKEFKKYGGRIDVLSFYRGRFLRLVPVMIPWAILNWIYCLGWKPLYPSVESTRGA